MTDIVTSESTSQHPLIGRFFHTTRISAHGAQVLKSGGENLP